MLVPLHAVTLLLKILSTDFPPACCLMLCCSFYNISSVFGNFSTIGEKRKDMREKMRLSFALFLFLFGTVLERVRAQSFLFFFPFSFTFHNPNEKHFKIQPI